MSMKVTKGITLNAGNVQNVFRQLQRTLDKQAQLPEGIILPIARRVLNRKRYSGKGRPKNMDYDYKRINWKKIFKNVPRGEYMSGKITP